MHSHRAMLVCTWRFLLVLPLVVYYAANALEAGNEHLLWKSRDSQASTLQVSVQIFLKDRNADHAPKLLTQLSSPSSPSYGKHWSPKQVADYFRPSTAALNAIHSWLADNAISTYTVSQSRNRFDLSVTVSRLESLLSTKCKWLKHATSKDLLFDCAAYNLPAHLQDLIDFIHPALHLPLPRSPVLQRRLGAPSHPDAPLPSNGLRPENHPHRKQPFVEDEVMPSIDDASNELRQCDQTTTIACLRALYNMPVGSKASPSNSIGVVEFAPRAYLDSDLDMFFGQYSAKQIGRRPKLVSIDEGIINRNETDVNMYTEISLDLQYAMALVHPQNVTLYQAGDQILSATFNTFLDALDATYCSGDDPRFDPSYPDQRPGGYDGPADCGKFQATKVISISYGSDEVTLPSVYLQRQCKEWLKLGLMGVSVIVGAGDTGVAGVTDQCIDPTTRDLNDGKSGDYNSLFVSSCPWVTSVGGTELPQGTSVQALSRQSNRTTTPEVAGATSYRSGGGFSNTFPTPDYQKAAIGSWWKAHAHSYNSSRFNQTGTRGSPDISAIGSHFSTALRGNFKKLSGTSASVPIIASMLSLINEERIAIGKSTVGFVNNVLYDNPEMFFDVVHGNNPGCGDHGFDSVPGWDPVTGLGTPNYQKMLQVFLSNP